jgi:hypothetical protein
MYMYFYTKQHSYYNLHIISYLRYRCINALKLAGNYVPAVLIICKAVFCVCGFCTVLTVNDDYFRERH